MGSFAQALLLVLVLPGLAVPSVLRAQDEPAAVAPEAPAEESGEIAEAGEGAPAATAKDVCKDLPELASDAWLDRMHRAVYRSVCGSAFWFDSFFGGEETYLERDATFGRIGLTPHWSEQDGFELDGRFRAKIRLPRLEKRLSAFLGRYEEDEFATDRNPAFTNLPQVFEQTTDQEWLVGLGYNPFRGERRRFDIDAGVKVDFPLDPFVRLRYRRFRFISDTSLVRFRQTLFWRGERGVGTTSHVDLERVLTRRFHVRWRNLGTIAEGFQGVDWESRVTLYHYLGSTRALAYDSFIKGETDAPVTVESYGFDVIYRQSAFRDWFFLELRAGLAWPQYEPGEIRDSSFGVGVGVELLFGNHP